MQKILTDTFERIVNGVLLDLVAAIFKSLTLDGFIRSKCQITRLTLFAIILMVYPRSLTATQVCVDERPYVIYMRAGTLTFPVASYKLFYKIYKNKSYWRPNYDWFLLLLLVLNLVLIVLCMH